ncbi:MAG TPA: response regulator [Telluria sp.]|nr:response regulator [Telluria sp.]
MHVQKYPFAVRLIGFAPPESASLAAALALAPAAGPAYAALAEDSLQDPDFYLANGDDLAALARLAGANPSAIQPALIVGTPAAEFPFPRLARPLDPLRMFELLAGLVASRAAALARITARGLPLPPERRRRQRLDVDLTDPAVYGARRRAPPNGAVLIIDKGGAFRDHVAKLLGARRLSVEWTDSASTAVRLCDETPVSLVLVNTSTPGIDPYRLCAEIKSLAEATRIAVVFLVGANFGYDGVRARAAGVRGMLDKPIADRHLVAALKKLLSLAS